MRSYFALTVACLLFSPVAFAAQAADEMLIAGLQAWVSNGSEAGLHTWYSDQPDVVLEMQDKLRPELKRLGDVIDTEVIAIQPISKRVTRYYLAVYFSNAPLWIRIERYATDKRVVFLPLRFSTNPDQILPSYLTDLQL